MNLNDVKKHVIFQSILYILIGLCFILSLFAILATPVSASEMKQFNISQTIKATNSGASWGTYSGCLAGVSTVPCWTQNINTSYNQHFNQLEMNVATNTWYQNAPSTIEIYNSANSFVNTSYSCILTASNSTNNIPCNVVYVNSGRIIVNFNTNLYSPETLTVYTTNQNYLNGDYININKVMLLETVDSANSDVISNANQNTTDIINNNNTNATETQNVIISMNDRIMGILSNVCRNYFDYNVDVSQIKTYLVLPNYSRTEHSVTATANGTWSYILFPLPVQRNTTYYVKYSRTNSVSGDTIFQVKSNDLNNNDGVIFTRYDSGTNASYSFTFNSGNYNKLYIRLYTSTNYNSGNTVTFNNIMISPIDAPYCVAGSYNGNKLDGIEGAIQGGLSTVDDSINDVNDTMEDVKDLQQEQNDYLMDDTNPSVPSSDINNVLGSVEVDDPLNYLLTLPISLLQKLNTVLSANSCSRVSFGTLYDTELYLPCINFENILGSTIWTTIDLIVGVGLLAIILKRFYDSISNILTMGKEKEVRDKLDLPTPMQFLASILGGGRD